MPLSNGVPASLSGVTCVSEDAVSCTMRGEALRRRLYAASCVRSYQRNWRSALRAYRRLEDKVYLVGALALGSSSCSRPSWDSLGSSIDMLEYDFHYAKADYRELELKRPSRRDASRWVRRMLLQGPSLDATHRPDALCTGELIPSLDGSSMIFGQVPRGGVRPDGRE